MTKKKIVLLMEIVLAYRAFFALPLLTNDQRNPYERRIWLYDDAAKYFSG